MSFNESPAFRSAILVAGTGPMPMMSGSHPATPHDTMRPSGCFFALSAVVTTTIAAPSTMPLALPAVTKPSFANAGFNFASPSSVVSGRR